jgi:RNA polymerase sigma-54 factor
MLNQRLQQKLLQKLSPQQIQMIKLLEVPTLQMEQRIKKELEDNPALEEGQEEDDTPSEAEEDQFDETDKDQEEFTLDDYIEEDDIPDYRLQSKNHSKDEDKRTEIPFSVGFSFHEHLESQLGLRDLTDKQKILGEYILGNIDDDGYLRRELINIVDDLAFLQNVETTESELDEVLKIIQDLEPAGVGARTLRECLLLQIEKRDKSHPSMKLAKIILDSYFEEFTKRHYDKIIARLGIAENELKASIDEVFLLIKHHSQ